MSLTTFAYVEFNGGDGFQSEELHIKWTIPHENPYYLSLWTEVQAGTALCLVMRCHYLHGGLGPSDWWQDGWWNVQPPTMFTVAGWPLRISVRSNLFHQFFSWGIDEFSIVVWRMTTVANPLKYAIYKVELDGVPIA